ncbi:cytochrome b/b6 domain-containing protein [Aureimonas glaciei]|uniref:Cytochrome b561 n=1 Tax=Aureimonas glaciei TaxID=1776957 RepID=A0A917DA36_9HYPH|nr:cytochrome b/b6 domain-containing protein [Aureimonas glaciei]GGD15857.1 cytochrome b561 [Aureimonas glaciei]
MRPEAIRGGGIVPLPAETATVRVWDPVVRIFHWGVVAACILNLFILEEGKMAHRYVGYTVAGLLAVRLVWGLVGSRHARFADFMPTPRRLVPYVRDLVAGREKRQLGHNPLAAVMMIVLMLLLALTAGTGFMSTLDAFWGVKWVKELHEVFANGILWLAVLHAVAAIVESRRHRENLIWSMVTGRKRAID